MPPRKCRQKKNSITCKIFNSNITKLQINTYNHKLKLKIIFARKNIK